MTWNYRLCKEAHSAGMQNEEVVYTFREVYYREDGSISAFSEAPAFPYSNSFDEMKWVLEKMQESLNKEVLDLDKLLR